MSSPTSVHRPDAHDRMTSISGSNPWFHVPTEIKVSAFPFQGEVLEFTSDTPVDTAFHSLVKHNVMSAPVWDEEKQIYLGFVDLGNLLSLTFGMDMMLGALPENSEAGTSVSSGKKSPASTSSLDLTLDALFDSSNSAAHCKSLLPWHDPVHDDSEFIEVLRLLAGPHRRVAITDRTTKRVTKIISQSAVVAELYKAIQATESPPPEFAATPRQTGIGLKPVFSVDENEPVKTAFKMMVENNITAVGVLDEEKKLLSCVTTKDIRLLPHLDPRMKLTGKSFLNKSSREYITMARMAAETLGKSHAAVASVGLDTPLVMIVGKLASTKMHRLFVVDAQHHAIGVISVSDVLSILVSQAVTAPAK